MDVVTGNTNLRTTGTLSGAQRDVSIECDGMPSLFLGTGAELNADAGRHRTTNRWRRSLTADGGRLHAAAVPASSHGLSVTTSDGLTSHSGHRGQS